MTADSALWEQWPSGYPWPCRGWDDGVGLVMCFEESLVGEQLASTLRRAFDSESGNEGLALAHLAV